MPPQLIDTHVHINFPDYRSDLWQVAERWRAAGVVQLVHSCVEPQEFPDLQRLADQFPQEVYLSVGLHPLHCENAIPVNQLTEQLYTCARDPRVVALGETGLDFFKATNQEQQIELFQAHIAVAQALDLPLIIHCREAADTALEVLAAAGRIRAVMHCWTGTPEETQRFVDLGYAVSFSGVVTFKKAELIQQSLQLVPLNQLLIETDCPYLAPVPMRGKRNEPAFVAHTAQKVADLRGLELADLAQLTTHNARQFFRLP
ncbi:TatD family hydrolase [Candidatus Cyanaurora vandensis]|uniref:TatD family hydrolase n=1 Tax=Candidatus Cyanaurora vandensis TaxID=2714958 RepID=UPI00257F514E|nr:TatD family hydrolase [Candidatus Cyanaurora vandensis]